MAILEKLRVRAGLLLAIVIGLALLAFVLSDFLDSGGSLFTRSKYEIAEVSGKSIPVNEYEIKVKELEEIQKLQSGQMSLDEATMDQIRNVTWENMIQDLLLEKQYEKLGIDVSDDELQDIIMGSNPHPAIAPSFTDPQTGIFSRQAFSDFIQRVHADEVAPTDKKRYLFIENEIYRQRKNEKYLNLIRKGLYATKFEATRQQDENARTADVNFIVQHFNTISDSAIKVTEQDITKYYNENKKQFNQTESRDIRYVFFDIVPSQADYKAAEQWIKDIQTDFEAAEDIKQFVTLESDEPYDEKNYNEGELPDTLNRLLFNAPVGTTYGPYFEDNAYRISRLAAINYLPDSVKARHILLQATQQNAQALFTMADSLVKMIKGGADFGVLAMTYSSDGSAQNGGDLGWFKENEMVKPFNDSCFYGKKGDLKIAPTQYGIHVIEILDQSRPSKQVQVGTLVKQVLPSEETDHQFYMKANEFAGKNDTYESFVKAVETENLTANFRSANNLAPMDKRVNDFESARQLVSWAYKAEEKEVSSVYKFDNHYVVATLEKIREEGPAPLEDIRAELEVKVRQLKKAEIIVAKINEKKASATTIEALANELGMQVQPVSGLRFSSSSLGNAGIEPKVVAAALALEKGVLSDPVVGENGVYVLNVSNITAPEAQTEDQLNLSRNYVERNFAARANYYAFDALKKLAEVKDNRRMFY
ncbi:MAG: SurA N-terminal domain-containing protein [Bacteroidales bacterium]|nr:SurA N-terminal domain-containing protein [Bacteroidales bacterium]